MGRLLDFHHLTTRAIIELAGVAVLILLTIIVALVIVRRMRERDSGLMMDEQPIDLSQRLGKLIDGISPEQAAGSSATAEAASDTQPAAAAGDGQAAQELAAPQTAVLAGHNETGVLGDATGMLGDATGMLNAEPPAMLSTRVRRYTTDGAIEPGATPSLASVGRETAGMTGDEILTLPGAQTFDYRALRALWQPIYTRGEALQTTPLSAPSTNGSWNTAILPSPSQTDDGWETVAEPTAAATTSDASVDPATTRDLASDPAATRDLTSRATTSVEDLPAPAERESGWETGPLTSPTDITGWDAADTAQDTVAGWDTIDTWNIGEVPAAEGAIPAADWAPAAGSLSQAGVLPEAGLGDDQAAHPDRNGDQAEEDWTHRLSRLSGLGDTMPPAAPPTSPLEGARPEQAGAEETPAAAEDTGSPLSGLERLSAYPVTEVQAADWSLARRRGEPEPEQEPERDEDGWEPVTWPAPDALSDMPHTADAAPTVVPEPAPEQLPAQTQSVEQPVALPPQPVPPAPAAPALAPAAVAPADLSLDPSAIQSLETMLAAIAALPDGQHAALVRRDGSPLVGSLNGGATPHSSGDADALLAATLAASTRCCSYAGMGAFDGLTLVGHDGMLLVMEVGPLALLAVVTTKDARLGPLRRSLRRHVDSLKELLSSHYVS